MSHRFRTPRIAQPRVGLSVWVWLIGLLLLLTLAWGSFKLGQRYAGYYSEASETEVGLLQRRVQTLQQERDQLLAEAARFERASQIDMRAVEAVQQDLNTLQQERSELRQELEFYKSLVSGSVSLLQITDVTLGLSSDDSYRFGFMVSKRAKGNNRVTGSVAVSVAGELDGEQVVLGAQKLGMEQSRFRMGFVHFQKFEGELKLPQGFEPRQLHVDVQPKGGEFKEFEQDFDWQPET